MFNTTHTRIIVLVALVVVQAGFLVWFGTLLNGGYPHPETSDLVDEYNSHVGSQVLVYGQVIETDPVQIQYDSSDGLFILTVGSLDREVSKGQFLEVYGEVREDREIEARSIVVRSERAHWYAYGISFLAGLWVLGRFLRDWRLDTERRGLAPEEKHA